MPLRTGLLFQEEDVPKEADHESVILTSILDIYLLFHFINSNGKDVAALVSVP